MNIQKTNTDSEVVLKLEGWLDTQAAPELKEVVDALGEDTKALVLDLAALEYISSAGLRQVVAAHKKMGGNLVLRNVSADILEILRLAGFDKRLHIER